ncbi:hypothetical protein [Acinetobacter sp. 'aerobic (ED)']|uniref:hypothetical protein n=1 Tax=Acinetobacter sp. 'aerobic (ED)' TaxID=174230 RepID=UPI00192B7D94|nr:hypothetical protein [Acinetobacter sp. 'aerobic (ED)']
MTMLVLLSHKDNVILAADKREVFFHDEIRFDVISDEVNKILSWNGGYISGCGYVPLLDKIKSIAIDSKTWTYDHILTALQDEIRNGNYHPHWINTTTFTSIFQTRTGYKAVYTQAQDIKAFCIEEGGCLILVNNVDTSSFKQALNELLSFSDIDLGKIIEILKELFRYASRSNGTVSAEFDLAIINNGGKGLASVG